MTNREAKYSRTVVAYTAHAVAVLRLGIEAELRRRDVPELRRVLRRADRVMRRMTVEAARV